MAAMQVLKCQRPLKSCVILAMVWCSLRSRRLRPRRLTAAVPCTLRGACGAYLVVEAIDAAEEAADAGDAFFLPLEVAVGRRGEERVHARGVGAVAGDHVVGRDDVALATWTSWRRL